ncbi:STAS domain-containing protein [Streptomyces sp. NPDC058662]|uniref:STAS domain-containing protein n=1 Tax=Streptomyces sp. NPDC058662 TaxID=3346583 RepID=UPI0036579FDC
MCTPTDAPIDVRATPALTPSPASPATSTGGPAEPDPVSLPRVRAALGGDGVLTVSLAGELDHYTCAPLHGLLDHAPARGAGRLCLDAAGVTFCDSALLHVLDHWARAGFRVELAGTSRAVGLLLSVAARLSPAVCVTSAPRGSLGAGG